MNIGKYFKFNLVFIACIGIAFILIPHKGMAQSDHFLSLTSGLQRVVGRDLGYSQLKYTGIRTVIALSYNRKKSNRTESLTSIFAKGTSKSRGGNSMETWSLGLISHTLYHRESAREQGFHFGWSLQNELNQRVHQSFSNFNNRMDYFSSVGPAIAYLCPISWGDKKLHWKTTAHVQSLGFKIASDYISSEPRVTYLDGNAVDKTWHALDIFRVGRDWSLGCWSELRYVSDAGNSLAFQHQFDFQQLSVVQEVIRIRNSFLVNLCVKL